MAPIADVALRYHANDVHHAPGVGIVNGVRETGHPRLSRESQFRLGMAGTAQHRRLVTRIVEMGTVQSIMGIEHAFGRIRCTMVAKFAAQLPGDGSDRLSLGQRRAGAISDGNLCQLEWIDLARIGFGGEGNAGRNPILRRWLHRSG